MNASRPLETRAVAPSRRGLTVPPLSVCARVCGCVCVCVCVSRRRQQQREVQRVKRRVASQSWLRVGEKAHAKTRRRTRAAMRLQRFVRRHALRRAWLELVDDLVGYARLMRQLRYGRAAARIQKFVRRRALRRRWLEMVELLSVNFELRRKQRVTNAVLRLQLWFKRRQMREHWLRVVEEARARRQLRILMKEERAKEAARLNWFATLMQAWYRGKVGRWLARARMQADGKVYDKLVLRREMMLRRHQAKMVKKRNDAALCIQAQWNRRQARVRFRAAVKGVLRIQRFIRHLRTRRRWADLLQQVATYGLLAARKETLLERMRSAGKSVIAQLPERAAAATRLQRFRRHMIARRKWVAVIADLTAYAAMVNRREAVLKRLRDAGKTVTVQRQKTNELLQVAQTGAKKQVLTRRAAALMLQRWWRHSVVRWRLHSGSARRAPGAAQMPGGAG